MTIINKFEWEKYQQLNKLVNQTQTFSNYEQQELAINQIAIILLRSRPLCRRFNGTPLTGVYRQIYNEVKAKLIIHLDRYLLDSKISQSLGQYLDIKELRANFLYTLQNQLFREILDDNKLKKMGLAVQKYPLNSELRAYGLNELIKAIKLSGRICRPHATKFSFSLYQMLYEEALTETFAYICLNIDLYDPNRGSKKFMNWVNYKLDQQILKCYERYSKNYQYEAFSYQDFEKISQPEKTPDLSRLLRDYISRDPDKIIFLGVVGHNQDLHYTPYSQGQQKKRLPGVMIHAQMTSHIIDVATGKQ